MAVDERHEPFWRRHAGALIVGGFVVLLAVIVAGQLFAGDRVADWLADEPSQRAYLLCFLFVWFDAVIPPGAMSPACASP